MDDRLFVEHPQPLHYLLDDSKLIPETFEGVAAEISLHPLHHHVYVGARVGLVHRVLVKLNNTRMPKFYHPLNLLNGLQLVFLIRNVYHLYSHVRPQPNPLMHDAEPSLSKLFSRQFYLLQVNIVLVSELQRMSTLTLRQGCSFAAVGVVLRHSNYRLLKVGAVLYLCLRQLKDCLNHGSSLRLFSQMIFLLFGFLFAFECLAFLRSFLLLRGFVCLAHLVNLWTLLQRLPNVG